MHLTSRQWLRALHAVVCILAGGGATLCAAQPDDRLPPRGVLVAHALGGLNGDTYTNSRDALLASYQAGKRWFEVDLALTADGQLVCFHEEQENEIGLPVPIHTVTTKEFLGHRYHERYQLITFEQLLALLRERTDAYLVTDTKRWTAAIADAVRRDLAPMPATLRARIVPQIYHPEDLALVQSLERDVGPFAGLIFTLYQTNMSDDDVVAFVKHTAIRTVTMSIARFNPRLSEALHRLGAIVLVHTINDPRRIAEFTRLGVDGFYTDFYDPAKHPSGAPAD